MSAGVDYSYSHPTPAQLKAAGKVYAVRYLTGSGAKKLTLTEVKALDGVGIDVVANFESTAGFMLGGYSAGVSVAKTAALAASAVGMPAGRPIYFSLDLNATYDQYKIAREFLKGAATVIGKDACGIYGGLFQVQWAHEDGVAPWVWQTYAWSYGQLYQHANLYQYHNGVVLGDGVVDLDRSLTVDYGQWGAKEQDMPLTEADKAVIRSALGMKAGESVATDTDVSTILRGDSTHPYNLQSILRAVQVLDPATVAAAIVTALENQGITVTFDTTQVASDVVTQIKTLAFKAS